MASMTFDELKRAVTALPPAEQSRFRAWFSGFIACRRGVRYVPTTAECEGSERGLRDAAEGKFASHEQVEAVFAKHRSET